MKQLLGGILLACLGTAAFAYGPLLPWSPVKPGYRSASFARARVYFDQGAPILPDYRTIDTMMDEAERFHRLRFRRPVTVIACKSWGDRERGLPWLGMRGPSAGEFLRHELSHALLSQNTTILKTHQLNDSPWFFEGLAVSFGRQQDYLTRDQFADMASRAALAGYLDPAQRYFVEYLKSRHGEGTFQTYLAQALAAPARLEPLFAETFGTPFAEAIDAYQHEVRAGAWPPAD